MMTRLWAGFGRLIFIVCIVAFTGTAGAETPTCAKRDEIASAIGKIYHEEPEAIGLTSHGQLLEVFVSPAGTFTVILTTPQGISCVAAVGEAWERKINSQRPES